MVLVFGFLFAKAGLFFLHIADFLFRFFMFFNKLLRSDIKTLI